MVAGVTWSKATSSPSTTTTMKMMVATFVSFVVLSSTPIRSLAPTATRRHSPIGEIQSRKFSVGSSSITRSFSIGCNNKLLLSTQESTQSETTSLRRSSPSMTTTTSTATTSSSTTTSLAMSGVEGDFDPSAISKAKDDIDAGSIKARLRALYKFTRPHTIRGTILASIAGTIRALVDTPGAFSSANWGAMLPRAFLGMFALLLGNAFIVGINQIYDKEIDEMNKPFLPVASGEMSKRAAWFAVMTSCIVGPVIVNKLFPPLLFRLYMFGLALGGIYSVPPIRTKKNPLLAGLTIATVRGFLLNFGVYYAVKDAIGASFVWSPKVSFIARFMTAFATVIAVTKDLPDIEGDRAFQIDTFATRVGVKRIAQGATACLLVNYGQALLTGILAAPSTFRMIPMIGGHVALASMLVYRYRQLDPDSMPSIKTYYKHIWDLFYLEYGLYTLI